MRGRADSRVRQRDRGVALRPRPVDASAEELSSAAHAGGVELTKRLFCVPGSRLAKAEENSTAVMQPFDELVVGFQISSSGLTISGACTTQGSDQPGCLLALDRQPLLLEPGYTNLPVAQLVQLLMLPAQSWLPASREANAMADGLPLPSAEFPQQKEVASRENVTDDTTSSQ